MLGLVLAPLVLLAGDAPRAPSTTPCAAQALALLSIDQLDSPVLPVIDRWQVFWNGVPLSDDQVAEMSGDSRLLARTRAEVESRSVWVFVGMAAAALGTAVSSVGWVLLGQSNEANVSLSVSLPLALGGLAVGAGGVLFTSHALQTPLEPLLAPTPSHRLGRDETRRVITAINRRLIARCEEAAAGLPAAATDQR